MILTKRTEVFVKIEMTEAQAKNLLILLSTKKGGHVNELSIQAEHGTEIADDVRETIDDLIHSLENQ